MLKLFKSDQLAKASKAIETDDLERLQKHLKKISSDQIDQPVAENSPALAELCILAQSAKALKQVLEHGANPNTQSVSQPQLSLSQLALTQETSLPLLTALYNAGCQTDPTSLLKPCFSHCREQELMLHLSLLLQQGANLDDELTDCALRTENRALIHFIINSGASKPEGLETGDYSDETLSYALKCWDDLRIRQMFL